MNTETSAKGMRKRERDEFFSFSPPLTKEGKKERNFSLSSSSSSSSSHRHCSFAILPSGSSLLTKMYFFLNFLLINAGICSTLTSLILYLLAPLLCSAFIQPLWTLECYTCGRSGFCPELVNMDGGDESDENDADPIGYNDDFYCEVKFELDGDDNHRTKSLFSSLER